MRIRGPLTALCVMVALVGCGDDPEPRTLPPIASASPSPSVVPLPSEAAAETPEGAAAFARYYFEVLNEAFRIGDASTVRRLSEAGCEGCNNLIGAIEEEPAAGERIEGGEYSILFAESPPVDGGDVVVELRYALSEVSVFADDGSVVETIPAEPGIDAQLRLVRTDGNWMVRGFRNVTS